MPSGRFAIHKKRSRLVHPANEVCDLSLSSLAFLSHPILFSSRLDRSDGDGCFARIDAALHCIGSFVGWGC